MMQEKLEFTRHHDPNKQIVRNFLEKSVLWFFEFVVVIIFYYYFCIDSRQINYITIYAENPSILFQFNISFWISLLFILFSSKIFKRTATIFGAVTMELYIEITKATQVQPVIIFYIRFAVLFESLKPYKGGEYYKGRKILQQLGFSMIHILIFLPILYFGFIFNPEYHFPANFSKTIARLYLITNFFINATIIILPLWFCFWGLDKFLAPYFPVDEKKEKIGKELTKNEIEAKRLWDGEEKEKREELSERQGEEVDVREEEEIGVREGEIEGKIEGEIKRKVVGEVKYGNQNEESDLEIFFPKQGEVFIQMLAHHDVSEDDHTIVIMLGKVRIYLCTRCTAMILGAFIGFFIFSFLKLELDVQVSNIWIYWIGILLPIVPLTDWGLQALHIRKATTKSRLITGFILGITMNVLSFSNFFQLTTIIIIIVYFAILGILMLIRKKKDAKLMIY